MAVDTCPTCSAALPADAPMGLCPVCLLEGPEEPAGGESGPASESAPASEGPLSGRFGDYELLAPIGRGGMGVVYRARHVRIRRVVALKMIAVGELASEHEVRRFRAEAEAAADLDHPHIVPLYEAGEHAGRPFFTMKLMEGGTLSERVAAFRGRARAAAELVATIARAVHHGHQRGVLHRDLKPDNILLDAAGAPHIADFGVAKRLESDSGIRTETGAVVGTPHYMAPEQAAGRAREITTAADVYSLGAILYELTTGVPPFSGGSAGEVLDRLRREPPVRPRAHDPSIPRDLEIICLRCLGKDPSLRYESAAELASDLDRFCVGEPILARPPGVLARARAAARRNPALTAGVTGTFALLVTAVITASTLAAEREEALIATTQESNAWGARLVAMVYLEKLERHGRAVAEEAGQPELVRLLETRDEPGLRALLDRVAGRQSAEFDNWLIQDERGIALARTPEAPVLHRDFSHRDYFRGARARTGARGVESVHVSRMFESAADGRHKLGITAPIWTGTPDRPRFLGVLAADWTTAPTMGLPGRRTALAGRADDGAPRYPILIHPAYHAGDASVDIAYPRLVELAPPVPSRPELSAFAEGSPDDRPPLTDDDYRDPLARSQGGASARWLAAFAPVGNTELVAIVQQPYDEVIAPDAKRTIRILILLGAALPLLVALGWIRTVRGRARA